MSTTTCALVFLTTIVDLTMIIDRSGNYQQLNKERDQMSRDQMSRDQMSRDQVSCDGW